MKYVVVILDGAAGWPLNELGGRTTLEAAHTPNLDELAREGMVGLAQTVPPGSEPSSAAACTSIIGYDPVADWVGRGAIEAASMGIALASDEVALRMNLVTIRDGVMASYAAGHITTEESRRLVSTLAEELDDDMFSMYPGVAYRHILVTRGHLELMDGAYTPPHDISDKSIALPSGPGSELLLDLMDRARPILASHPVNASRRERGLEPATDIWPFWPGVAPAGMVPFRQRRAVRAAMTSGVDLLMGLAVLAGIDRLHIEGVTDGADTDYAAQATKGLAALADHELVVIHVESPDEEGHAGSVEGKISAIERIDSEVVSVVRRCADTNNLRILAMPDHPTPIGLKTHVGEPVPFVLWGPGIARSGAGAYSENEARDTGILVDPGRGVVDLLLG